MAVKTRAGESKVQALASLRQLAAHAGWPVAWLYLLHRGLGLLRVGHVVPYALMAQPIGQGAYAAVRDDPATVTRIALADDALSAALPRPDAVNRARWAQAARCHLCSVKGQFAGTIWIQRDHYDEDEVQCRYVLAEPATSVWDFDVYVEPSRRLGRTLGRLWKAVDAQLAAEGVRWSFSRISKFNPASMNSHARLGAVPIGWATFVVLGRVQLALASTAPHLHLSWRGARRPSYRLHPPAAGATAR